MQADPLVQAVLARFPGAEIVEVRTPEQPATLPGDEPTMPLEPPPADDGSYGADWRDERADNE